MKPFLMRKPSHYNYKINSIVKASILSEAFFWAGYNFIYPLLSIFVLEEVVGGSIETAALTVSVYMIVRIFSEVFCGRILEGKDERTLIKSTILGFIIVAISFWSLSLGNTIGFVYLINALVGLGLGIASPARNSIFSDNIEKEHATNIWGLHDAMIFVGMSLSALIGGIVAQEFGFALLFKMAAVTVLVSMIPFIYILKNSKSI